MTIEAGQTLSHYRLIQKIGEGGMGVVWQAEDTVLNRRVAIKVLPVDISRDDARRQLFLQEAQLAGSISDGRIVQIYEFGEEAGLDFIVMEYVDGKPLNRLIHGRPLPPEKVAEFGLEAATALSRAHRKGLIHRDLKPANIMVTPDGDVKVLDFGLAVLFERGETTVLPDEATRTVDETEPTSKGTLAGTLSYMSPEQTRCEELDSRSDIFSLGVILYEMATGQRPFIGATPAKILEEIQTTRPAPPHTRVRKLPLELDRIIQKALARRRSNRYQSMDDLAVDLRRLGRELDSGSSPSYEDLAKTYKPTRLGKPAPLAAAVLLLAVMALVVWRFLAPAGPLDERTILVVPLDVRGQGEGADYVGRAFAEGLAVRLARSNDLDVLPVPASIEDGTAVGHARDSGAGRLLVGALTREGSGTRVSLSLVDVTQNRIVWGTEVSDAQGEFAPLASSLSSQVVEQLGAILPRQYEYPHQLAVSPEMAQSSTYIQMLASWRRGGSRAAGSLSRQLVDAFPQEFDAHVIRLRTLGWLLWFNPTLEVREEFNEALAKVDRLDPENPYGQIERAIALRYEDRERESIEALTEILTREDLAPSFRSWALRQRAACRNTLGEPGQALVDLEAALLLDPTLYANYAYLSGALRRAGRSEDAIVAAHQAIALAPESGHAHDVLAWALATRNEWEDAAASFGRACDLTPTQQRCAPQAYALLRAGRDAEARAVAEQAANMESSLDGSYDLACYYALAGDNSAAIQHLRRALELGYASDRIASDPDLESLHGDPEFEAVVAEARKQAGVE